MDYKITQLQEYPELSVSLDYDEDVDRDAFMCLLYVPNPDLPEHEHIKFRKDAALKLRDWINDNLDKK